jgi:hypothetical protein
VMTSSWHEVFCQRTDVMTGHEIEGIWQACANNKNGRDQDRAAEFQA